MPFIINASGKKGGAIRRPYDFEQPTRRQAIQIGSRQRRQRLSVEQVHRGHITVSDRELCAVGAKGNGPGGIPPCAVLWREDKPEAAVIEPDHAVAACRGNPAIGGECEAVNAIAVIRVAKDLGPFLITVENAQTVGAAKPSRKISAIMGENEALGDLG